MHSESRDLCCQAAAEGLKHNPAYWKWNEYSSKCVYTCYPGEATVQVLHGSRAKGDVRVVRMDELAIGDHVLVDHATRRFEPVIAFGHRDPMSKAMYLQFTTVSATRPLEIAAGHYLYLADGRKILPEEVRLGDELHRGDAVTRIKRVMKPGVFHPHTWSAKLVVNGFQTSTDTTYTDQAILDYVVTPAMFAAYQVGLPIDMTPGSVLWQGDQFMKQTKWLQDALYTIFTPVVPTFMVPAVTALFGVCFLIAAAVAYGYGLLFTDPVLLVTVAAASAVSATALRTRKRGRN